MSLKILYFAKT